MLIGKILTNKAILSLQIMNKGPVNAPVEGVRYFSATSHLDNRGSFTKIWSTSWEDAMRFCAKEIFYSDSLAGVIRGMHLQTGPAACTRYISVLAGRILDVVLDLRPDSPSFLNFQGVEMDILETSTVHVPAGVAHGFQALENARTLYVSSENHDPSLDKGINVNTFGFDWPLKNTIQSNRDQSLPSLSEWLATEL